MSLLLTLEAAPASLPFDALDQLKLTLTARNVGVKLVDPELHRAQLAVNGRPARAFALAVANGKRAEKWFALPAGDEVSMTWSTLGERVIFEPGTYTLALALDDAEAQPVTVTVTP